VVIAHGVQRRQDAVFLAYKEQFDTLTEADFVDFWCIYLISLAYEQFIRSDKYVQFAMTRLLLFGRNTARRVFPNSTATRPFAKA
jgi:hypothetical protein